MAYRQKTPLFFQTTQSDGTVVKTSGGKKKGKKKFDKDTDLGASNIDGYEKYKAANNGVVTDGGEAQDQDKIFDDNGVEIGHWEGNTKVMNKNNKQ